MDALRRAAELAERFLAGVDDRPAGPAGTADALRLALPETGIDPVTVVEELADAAADGLVASAGPRYFGFVTGGALPAALGADWLASTWDQNAFSAVSSPAAATAEDVAGCWIKELLGLPAGASAGLTTGAQMANVTALAAARHAVLDRVGWDVGERGLAGAPAIRLVAGAEMHATVPRALRLLGLGAGTIETVPVDGQGALRADALELDDRPTIVCAQAGNVNTGAFDPLEAVLAARGANT